MVVVIAVAVLLTVRSWAFSVKNIFASGKRIASSHRLDRFHFGTESTAQEHTYLGRYLTLPTPFNVNSPVRRTITVKVTKITSFL
jgi:hypothetical protein